jgi:hypothetical protein
MVWTLFRLENEYLNNVENFRVVTAVPLLFTPGASNETLHLKQTGMAVGRALDVLYRSNSIGDGDARRRPTADGGPSLASGAPPPPVFLRRHSDAPILQDG